jgi:hypothetical protein
MDRAFLPLWTSGGSLFFFSDGGLYQASAPDFVPTSSGPATMVRDAVLLEVP